MAAAKTRRSKSDIATALAAVKESSVKQVLDEMTAAQTNVQGTLAGLSVLLTEKIEELKHFDTAIDAKKNELQELHDIEVQADTLDEILQSVKTAEQEAAEKTKLRSKQWADEAAEQQQQRQRDQETHDYNIAQATVHAEQKFHAEQEERKRLERIRAEDVDRDLTARIAAVEEREAAMAAKEAELATFPEKLEKAVADAEARVTKQLETGYAQSRMLLVKDNESAAALAKAEKLALNGHITQLQEQLTGMQVQLAAARDDARNIAQSALDASSGRKAQEAMQETIKATSSGGSPGRGR